MPAGRQGAAGPGNTPVRTCPPNGYGLYDVAGKVWEWPATTSPRASAIPPPRPPAHLGIHASTIRPRPRPVPTASPAASSRARVAPVRPELLPALPTRRPPGPIRGRRHLSSGLPLRASPTATGDQPRPPDWAPALSRILTQ
ncbi:SUMF1/EgtB/PvdO family nonheme iron enzyme [Streptomyces canus]|uniref:SUMF1/EgtB/PvdO family nonheme iron enzyme n=1 Tax=Streptomyces canus TaxID=58343 RepID=UPI003869E69D